MASGGVDHIFDYIRTYLIINTSNWWLGHKVLIAPEWINEVRWIDQTVSIDLNRKSVKEAPAYDSSGRVDYMTKIALYRHYLRPR